MKKKTIQKESPHSKKELRPATKGDVTILEKGLQLVESGLRKDIQLVESGLRKDMAKLENNLRKEFDNKIDDLAATTANGFLETDKKISELKGEMSELKEEFSELRNDVMSSQDRIINELEGMRQEKLMDMLFRRRTEDNIENLDHRVTVLEKVQKKY